MKTFNHIRSAFRLQFLLLTHLLLAGAINLYAQVPAQEWNRIASNLRSSDYYGSEKISIAADSAGNIYATSRRVNSSGTNDIFIVKYTNTGTIIWQRIYNGPGNGDDIPVALKLDKVGRVIVAGVSEGLGTRKDYVVIKYSAAGSLHWVRRFNGTGSGDDIPADVAIDGDDNIIVTGSSQFLSGAFDDFDYRTIKYNTAGTLLWDRTFNGADHDDRPAAVAVDTAGNVYVTGSGRLRDPMSSFGHANDFVTIKYSSLGAVLWNQTHDHTNIWEASEDFATDIAVDEAGDVVVVGDCYYGTESTVIKYSSSGTMRWINHRHGDALGIGELASKVAINHRNEIFISSGELKGDYLIQKYSASGALLWDRSFSDFGGHGDRSLGNDIVVDAAGDAYICGSTLDHVGGVGNNYKVVKYTSGGDLQWIKNFEGASSTSSYYAYALALDRRGNVFVAGKRKDGTDEYAPAYLLTVKYHVPSPALSTRRINSAGPAVHTGGRSFSADGYFSGFTTARRSTSIPDIGETTDDILYITWREAVTSEPFSYNIPVVNGTYKVSLHFAELVHTSSGQRRFNVNLEGGAIEIVKLDVYATAGYGNALVRTFIVSVTDGMLNIDFTNMAGRAMISAIEVEPPLGIPIGEWPLIEEEVRIFYVFPNPAHDKLTIQTHLKGEIEVQVADQIGNVKYAGKHVAENEAIELDISSLKPDLYIVRLLSQDGTIGSVHFVKE